MISEEKRKLIEEKMLELPPAVKDAVDSSGWEKKIFDIGRRYKLHIDHLDLLQFELALAMVGISDQAEFMHQVKESTGLDDNTVDKIVGDINTEIFSHIREKLKTDVYNEETPKATAPSIETISDPDILEMKKAGISLGGEEEGVIESAVQETDAPETPVALSEASTETPEKVEPKPATPAPVSAAQVFKTKTAQTTIADKPKNYFDPYREPLE